VADGLGGHEGGAHASFVCCRSFLHSWRKGHAAIDSAVAAERFLRSAIIAANDAVFAFNHGCRERPMGCTVVAAVFLRDAVATVNAGDSRFYIYNRNGGLRQLSVDHTLLEMLQKQGRPMSDAGQIDHVVTRAVGVRPRIRISCRRWDRLPDDYFLLCSDGVSGCCPEKTLADLLDHAANPREAVSSIIRHTLIAGAPDNATAIVAMPSS